MNIAPTTGGARASDFTPEQLLTSSVIDEQGKVAELARQFEAVMLRQMLRDARQPSPDGILGEGSSESRAYHDIVTERLADTMSRGGGLGVASSLQAQLLRQIPDSSHPAPPAPPAPRP
jgi:Rod binding domain-containing protein